MSTVLIWFVVIVGIVGILLFWSLANTAGWADDRMEEIKNRETSCEAVITNQSSISGGMAMANKEKKIEGRQLVVSGWWLFLPQLNLQLHEGILCKGLCGDAFL